MHIIETEAIFVREWQSMLAARRRRFRLIILGVAISAAILSGPLGVDADAAPPFLHAICLC